MDSCDLLEGCSQFCCEPVRELIDSEVNAPFIEVKVKGSAGTITVGNLSQPQKGNHAAVKSLKYGHTAGGGGGGLGLEVEVADEAGGAFATFVSSIISVQDFNKIKTDNWIQVKWGWIEESCENVFSANRFCVHTLNLVSIEFSYQNGLMKFNLKGQDITEAALPSAVDKVYGTDDKPMPLKQAITAICQEYGCSVQFLRPRTLEEWNFGDPATKGGSGDPDFPKQSWKSHSQNFLQAIMRWIAPYRTDRGLGITPSFNSRLPPGSHNQLILWESFAHKCGELKSCDNSIGTYIVNGGKHSPVLSFQPNLKWVGGFAMLNKSSGASSKVANQQPAEQGDKNCDTGPNEPNQGNRTYNLVSDDAINIYGTKTALKSTMDSQVEHAKANVSFDSIDAELKIQGDPFLADPVFMVGKNVSIVVINPFHIQENVGSGDCGDWLQTESCNSVLSNRQWQIKGTSHELKEGSYTTTIKVRLDAPGTDISIGEPLGADPSGYNK